jgi:taurine dioxygenase
MTIAARALTPEIGAEVTGLDLRKPLEVDEVTSLQQLLRTHLVLFFPQQDIGPDEHVAFARNFGEISIAPFGQKVEGHAEVLLLDQITPKGEGADRWHADNTYMPEPPLGSILRAVKLPRAGGDTCFASMFAAYEALSQTLRAFLDTLYATHDMAAMFARASEHGKTGDADFEALRRNFPPFVHPVVRLQPETGRRALFVNGNWTTRINGLNPAESDALLALLFEHVRTPDFQCRFRWEPGSMAFWDNRWVQHYAVPDYRERRVMHRVTVAGDRPLGVAPSAASTNKNE